jgi:xylulokinase
LSGDLVHMQSKTLLLGLDIGTTAAKALLIDENGNLVAAASRDYPLSTPQPGWAEQNPDDWWQATKAVIAQLCANARGAQVAALGLTGQMHGSVFLDSSGRVIRPAILWCDQRTAADCLEIERLVGPERLVQITRNPVLTGFTAPKVLWLKRCEPAGYAMVAKLLLPKDFIRFKLTGCFASEVSDASGTSLFDVGARCWSAEILAALGIPESWMPQVSESPEITARIPAAIAAELGLPAETPVVGGAGDQAAGAVGCGICEQGLVSCSIGTSGVIFSFAPAPAVDPHLALHTFCHAVPNAWHHMGVMLSSGGSLRWFRDTFAPEIAYDYLCEEAAPVAPGADGLFFLPYLAGERTPHKDPNARGAFVGIGLHHARPHFVRAVLEGVAFGLRDSLELMRACGLTAAQIRLTGGGAKSRVWRQILADVFGTDCVTLNVDEGPAFGAAILAGVGVGVWPTVPEACRACVRLADLISPIPSASAAYQPLYSHFRSLYPTLRLQQA